MQGKGRRDYRELVDLGYRCLSLMLFAGCLWLLVWVHEVHLKASAREGNNYSDHWKHHIIKLLAPALSRSHLTLSMPLHPSDTRFPQQYLWTTFFTEGDEEIRRWVENLHQLYSSEYVVTLANYKLPLGNHQENLKMQDSKNKLIKQLMGKCYILFEDQIAILNDILKLPAKGLNCKLETTICLKITTTESSQDFLDSRLESLTKGLLVCLGFHVEVAWF